MKKIILFTIWIILCMAVITNTSYLLTYSNTIGNIIGFLSIVLFVLLSYWTKCFTNNKINLTNKKKQ